MAKKLPIISMHNTKKTIAMQLIVSLRMKLTMESV